MAEASSIDASRDRQTELGGPRQLGEPLRVVPHTRPLLFHDGQLYCARFDRILTTPDLGLTFRDVCRLELPPISRLLGWSPLAQRIVRSAVYRMRVLADGSGVFVFRGGIYVRRPGKAVAQLSFRPPRGSRPVSLAVGEDNQIVFGEYFCNAKRAEVNIYGSVDSGMTWRIVHSFPAGSIRHVHGISYDRWLDGYWICTGDVENENQLLFATPDFSHVEIRRQGGQQNRFYYLQVLENEIITATDTPHEQNHILAIDKSSGQADIVGRIENTNFYGCRVGEETVLSTNVEPSEINDTTSCHLWLGSAEHQFSRIASMEVDAWERVSQSPLVRSGLFQYPRIFFPEGENTSDRLVCQPIGLRPHADAMVVYAAPAKAKERRHDQQAA